MAKGLGRGLDALIPGFNDAEHAVLEVQLNQLRPNPYQPRKNFSESSLKELTDSIREHGMIQPIVVRQSIKGYEIVAGERRWRAAKLAGLKTIPVIVSSFSDEMVMEIALVENLQREDLNPMEIARAYDRLMRHLGITQEELARRVGKSRPNVANFLRLMQLPNGVQNMVSEGLLTMGHARCLLGLEFQEQQMLAERVVKENLSVRELENLVQKQKKIVSRETKKKPEQVNLVIKETEEKLQQRFGTSVKIKPGKKKGQIEIEYFSDDDLNRIVGILLVESQTKL